MALYDNSVTKLSYCGNFKDENNKLIDPLTLEPLPNDLTRLIKIGNQCYNRQSIRDFLLSKNNAVEINLDDGTMDEWTTGAYQRIKDPMTNLWFELPMLKNLYYFGSENRERAAKGSRRRRQRRRTIRRTYKRRRSTYKRKN